MLRTLRLSLMVAAILSVPGLAAAAPITVAPEAPVAGGLVVQVHGCHRACLRGYVPRWDVVTRHRHVGPGCQPRVCGRRYGSRPPGWAARGCFALGPVWYCP